MAIRYRLVSQENQSDSDHSHHYHHSGHSHSFNHHHHNHRDHSDRTKIFDKQSDQLQFSINETSGEIFVHRALDRDRPNGKEFHQLRAYVENLKNGDDVLASADILIHLRNINDNDPFFEHRIYEANVTENSTAGSKVIQISAIDYDLSEKFVQNVPIDSSLSSNNRSSSPIYELQRDLNEEDEELLLYSIERNVIDLNGKAIFKIDPFDGWITTDVCCLDREKHSNYTIIVSARDRKSSKVSIF